MGTLNQESLHEGIYILYADQGRDNERWYR
jgi:hypothetical protein